jgi:hypothetical protein
VTISGATTNKCDFEVNTSGGYTVRLTVNAGLPDESITNLYFGIPLEGSGLLMPAFNETNEDNFESPYTGERGYSIKANANVRSLSAHVWQPNDYESSSRPLLEAESGYAFTPTIGSVTLTLPTVAQGLQYHFYGGSVGLTVSRAGSDTITGTGPLNYGETWTSFTINAGARVSVLAKRTVSGTYTWELMVESGGVASATSPTHTWSVGTVAGEVTLDEAYNASAGASVIEVDAGDVTWELYGARSFNVDVSNATGTVDGFHVNNGTDYFRATYKGADTLDIESALANIAFNASGNFNLVGNVLNFKDQYLSSAVPISQSGTSGLSGFTATSIVGALNELKTGLSAHTLDAAYDASGGASTVTVDAGNITWDVNGSYDFNIDLTGVPVDAGYGFKVYDGSDYFHLLRATGGGASMSLKAELVDLDMRMENTIYLDMTANDAATKTVTIQASNVGAGDCAMSINTTGGDIDVLTSSSGDIRITAVDAMQVYANGGNLHARADGGDLQLGGDEITFDDDNRSGSTFSTAMKFTDVQGEWNTFETNFGEVSLINALNQAYSSAGAVTLDDAYDASGGASTITMDAGDVNWDIDGAYSFQIDLTDVSTDETDGFIVFDATDYFKILRKTPPGPASLTLDTDLHAFDLKASYASQVVVNSAASGTQELKLESTNTVGTSRIYLHTNNGNIDMETDSVGDVHMYPAGDVAIDAGDDVTFSDSNRSGSTYSALMKFSDAASEWSTFETNFGEVSLLNAINQAAPGVFVLGGGTLSSLRTGSGCTTAGNYAFATGQDNDVGGAHSFAAGYDNTAGGNYSAAFGDINNISGTHGGIFGDDNEIQSNYSGAFGGSNIIYISAAYSFVAGYNNDIVNAGPYSVAFGEGSTVGGSHSIAVGYSHSIANDCDYSAAFGYNQTIASAKKYSIVAGSDNYISGEYSAVFGAHHDTYVDYSVVHGRGAKPAWHSSRAFAGYVASTTSPGTSQCQEVTIYSSASGASPSWTEMKPDGSSAVLTLEDKRVYECSFQIVATKTWAAGSPRVKSWNGRFLVVREGTSVDIVGSDINVGSSTSNNDEEDWDIRITTSTDKVLIESLGSADATYATMFLGWLRFTEIQSATYVA